MKTAATALAQLAGAIAPRSRLGFLGLGWIGLNRLAAIARADVAEIVAISDPMEETFFAAAEYAPKARRFHNPNELFDIALDLDAIVIATPSAQHTEQCIAALNRGLAVFCQKPLGRNAAEVCEVIDAARSMNRLLLC